MVVSGSVTTWRTGVRFPPAPQTNKQTNKQKANRHDLDTADRHGLGVSAQAMRDAWLIDALQTLPCREALALGVDHKRLTAIAAHVPRPSASETAAILRGAAV
jgi:hypothetical protein